MYPMSDPSRKSLRGAPWDGPSLTCYKKRSPNMGTKTCTYLSLTHAVCSIKKDPQTWGRKHFNFQRRFNVSMINIKKDPQTWGRKQERTINHGNQKVSNKKRSPNMGTKT